MNEGGWFVAVAVVLALSAVGCTDEGEDDGGGGNGAAPLTGGGGAGGAPATGGGGANAGGDGGMAGAGGGACDVLPPPAGSPIANVDDPCATLNMGGEPEARVVFLDKGEDSTFSNAIELMYAFRYAVKVPTGTESSYTIEQERCAQLAGDVKSCEVLDLGAPTMDCAGPIFGPKFAVDPSQYNVGDNVYDFTMRLVKNQCEIVSTDSFEMTLTYAP
ncbi:MAG: hypothetical protein U0271_00105 [Polyangiaceae bacterium]